MKLIPFSCMLVSMYMVFEYSEMNKITVNGIHNKAYYLYYTFVSLYRIMYYSHVLSKIENICKVIFDCECNMNRKTSCKTFKNFNYL